MNRLRVTLQDLRQGKIIVVDKPLDWTSFDVVNKIRSVLRKRFDLKKIKVGHAGTLDPKATGVLVIGIGPATKLLGKFQADDKVYEGLMRLGATTPSYDTETDIDKEFPLDGITEEMIRRAAQSFIGDIEQLPPPYSAVKQKGKKLYELAREGKEVELKPRRVKIYDFEIKNIQLPDIQFALHAGKGTYVRSLVHDFGKKLNNGAYLIALRRIRSGNFTLDQAVDLFEWVAQNQ